jgi:hypothetical protein
VSHDNGFRNPVRHGSDSEMRCRNKRRPYLLIAYLSTLLSIIISDPF